MGMPDTAHRYTVDEVLAFPEDGNRYELVHGELLVSPGPTPRHQLVIGRLRDCLRDYLVPVGRELTLFLAPADITWDNETLVQPDILVVPPEEVSNDWKTFKTLQLAVEVLSPSTARFDRLIKRRLYQQQSVETYWIVDHQASLVEVWHPDDERPEIVTDTLTWSVTPASAALTIEVASLFEGLPT